MVKRPLLNRSDDNNGNDDDDDNGRGGGLRMKVDPLIRSLLHHLPKAGDVWLPAERENWMNLLEGAFKVIYKDTEPPPKGAAGANPPSGTVRTP